MATQPPNDLDRLASAWRSFQDFVNVRVPALRYRCNAVYARMIRTSPSSGPKPS